MDIYEAVNQRRTIRDFQDKEVPIEVIHKILNAGLKAPTNDHLRNWEFIVITDKEEKAKIINKIPKIFTKKMVDDFIEYCKMTDPCQINMYLDGVPKQYSMLLHSGAIILPFFRQDYPLLKSERLSSLNAFASIWCCIENILLAATAEGLGCVTRIPSEEEAEYLREVLGHPANYIMPCYISMGFPTDDAVINIQKEYDASEKLHINRW